MPGEQQALAAGAVASQGPRCSSSIRSLALNPGLAVEEGFSSLGLGWIRSQLTLNLGAFVLPSPASSCHGAGPRDCSGGTDHGWGWAGARSPREGRRCPVSMAAISRRWEGTSREACWSEGGVCVHRRQGSPCAFLSSAELWDICVRARPRRRADTRVWILSVQACTLLLFLCNLVS